MSDLDDLYQEVILDHGRSPRNFHALPGASHHAEGYNPLCGDRVHVELILRGHGDGTTIDDIAFTGAACAICLASASMMTEHVKGLGTSEARRAAEDFRRMLVGEVGGVGEVSHGSASRAEAAPTPGREERTADTAAAHAAPPADSRRSFSDSPLHVLAGVRRFPMRVKCATLPWHTLLAALDSGDAAARAGIERTPVSTE